MHKTDSKDITLIGIAGLIYILNIVDAVVDAHLYEGRKILIWRLCQR
jgi:hypothetical protein